MASTLKIDFLSFIGGYKLNATLISVTLSLFSIQQLNAQDLSRIDRRIEKIGLKINKDEVERETKIKKEKIHIALDFLEKNPRILKERMDLKRFLEIKKVIKSDRIEDLKAIDIGKIMEVRHDKKGLKVELMSDLKMLEDLGQSIIDASDSKNLVKVYRNSYDLLDQKTKEALIDPMKLESLSLEEIRMNLNRLLEIIKNHRFPPVKKESPGFTYKCDEEIGQEHIGVGDGANRCLDSEFHADSLYKNSSATDFPLKYYHTCIKNQANRGTCVSFAINGVLESLLMIKEDKAYNLSEQFTYLYGEVYSDHLFRYDYGLPTGDTIAKMDEKNVRFQYEQFWEYNPSRDMDDNKTGDQFLHSCDNYSGEMCTNFAFQGRETITGFWPFLDFTYTVPSTGTAKNIQVIDRTNIFMWWNVTGSLDNAIALTKNKVPLVLSFNVRQNFMDTDETVIVSNVSGSDSIGGHAAIILGFVENSKLPAGVPQSPEKGYFIVKNSWGTGNGDCGYYYVDYRYLRNNVNGIFTISIN